MNIYLKEGHTYILAGGQEKKYNWVHRIGIALLASIKTLPLGIGLLFKSTREDWKAVFTGKKVTVFYAKAPLLSTNSRGLGAQGVGGGAQAAQQDRTTQRNLLAKNGEAIRLMELAEQGDAKAQCDLGNIYFKHQLYDEAVSWFHKAADLDYVAALLALGGIYGSGRGVEKNSEISSKYFQRGVGLLQQAADSGDSKALYSLGSLYDRGLGVERDGKKAFEYFQQAADQGDADAQYRLGSIYSTGLDENYRHPFRDEIEEGTVIAVEKDLKKAVEYYQLAADQKHGQAQFDLGICYQVGWGVEKNQQTANKYYQSASQNGVRIPRWLLDKIDLKRKMRVGTIPRNLWILEQIEKATQE